jgi:hypothetical protein
MLLSGDSVDVIDHHGEPVRDETFFVLINAHFEPIPFLVPGLENLEWEVILDTGDENGFVREQRKYTSGDDVDLAERATIMLRLTTAGAQERARQESWKKRRYDLPAAITADELRAGRHKPGAAAAGKSS